MRYVAGGGSVNYSGYKATTHQFDPETRDGSVLVAGSDPADPYYERHLPDCTVEKYYSGNGARTYPRRVFLTELIDPAGNGVTLWYGNLGGPLRLTDIIDATGRHTTLSYEMPNQPLLVTRITDPVGRSAQLAYDPIGRLRQITDVVGLTSQFNYDSSSLINSMTTPYGTTTFSCGDNGNTRFLQATDPLGNTERLEYIQPLLSKLADRANWASWK